MQQHEPIVIRTDYTSSEDLSSYVDGFLKGQAVAVSLIGEQLISLGFAGANALMVDILEWRRYQFRSKDDDPEGVSVSCPACGRLMPPS